MVRIDQIVVGIGKERGAFARGCLLPTVHCAAMSREALAGRVSMGGKLWLGGGRCPEGFVVQGVEILAYSTGRINRINLAGRPVFGIARVLFLDIGAPSRQICFANRLPGNGSNWRRPQSPRHRPIPHSRSGQLSSQIHGAADRFRVNDRDGSWKSLNDPGFDQPDQGGRTNDRPGSDAPPRKAAVRTGCRSSIRSKACALSCM